MHLYLYQYVARLLHTTIRFYHPEAAGNNSGMLFLCSAQDAVSDTSAEHLILQYLQTAFTNNSVPVMISACRSIYYLIVPENNRLCILGPLRLDDAVLCRYSLDSENSFIYLDLLTSQFSDSVKWPEPFITCSLSECIDSMLLIYNLERTGSADQPFILKETILSENFIDISMPDESLKKLSDTEFSFVENGIVHNPYQHETNECNSIRNGDTEGLLKLQKLDYSNRFGKLSDSSVRNNINHGIVAVTTASRAAIEGGLHPETAFHLSDITIQKLDKCKDNVSPVKIYKAAQLQYAQLVNEILNQQNSPVIKNRYISLCKDYIFTHLHGKISVREIANAIGLDANYLSALFTKCEKITLKQFILNEKIKLVKNLLIYSNYSYTQIATYLGFSSQSHMGMEFKKVTGMTPHAFRLEYGNEDFIAESVNYQEKKASKKARS